MAPVITAKENTCLIRLSWIISSELHLRCSDEGPLNEDSSQGPGPPQQGIDTEESGSDFGYAYRVFDNEDILLELDGSNNITARYTHGPGIDEPLIMEKGGQSFFYHADSLGSITEITDATGSLKQQYTYSSFGKIESQLDPTFVQPYTFTAREFDPETGLYYYRSRYYDPQIGRFISEDKFPGIASAPETQNKYPYVANQPLNFTDPSGNITPLIGAALGFGMSIALDKMAGRSIDWGEAAKNAAIGAVGGNLLRGGRMLLSGVISLAQSTFKELTDCDPAINFKEIASDVAISALTGAIGNPLQFNGTILSGDKIAKIIHPQNFIRLNAKQNALLTGDRIGRVLFEFNNQAIERILDNAFTSPRQ